MYLLHFRSCRLHCLIPLAFVVLAVTVTPSFARPLAGEITIGGTGAALGTMHRLADEFKKSHPEVRFRILPSLGSGGGVKALVAAQLSLSVSSRPLTEAELAKGLQAKEIARTPFVFATAMSTPADKVTLDEVAALYAGKTTAWPNGTQVRLVLRPVHDVDTDLVKGMSSALSQAVLFAHQREGRNIAVTDTDSADEIERIPGAIGTSTLALIQSEARQLKPLAINGVVPTTQNLASGKYVYQKSIYLVAPAQPSAPALGFMKFIDSPAGAAILTRTGSLPVTSTK